MRRPWHVARHAVAAAACGLLVCSANSGCHLDALLSTPVPPGQSDSTAADSVPGGGTPDDSVPPLGGGASLAAVSGGGQQDTVAATLARPYVVQVRDDNGRAVEGVAVTWTVTRGAGSVTPARSVTDADGLTSATHTLGTTAGSQEVMAGIAGASPVTFAATATAATPAGLTFTRHPSDTPAGATITPAVRVAVQDQFGNLVTAFDGSIAMRITPLTGTPLATLSGTRTRSVSSGSATFDDLSINLPGLQYRLRATAGPLTTDSHPFDVP